MEEAGPSPERRERAVQPPLHRLKTSATRDTEITRPWLLRKYTFSPGQIAQNRTNMPIPIHTGGDPPAPEVIENMRHKAHESSFMALSVKTEVRVEPA